MHEVNIPFERPDWMHDGECRHHPEVNFFPERGESPEPAKTICRTCPVAGPCLNYALNLPHQPLLGVWSGTTELTRRRLRKTSGLARRPPQVAS